MRNGADLVSNRHERTVDEACRLSLLPHVGHSLNHSCSAPSVPRDGNRTGGRGRSGVRD